MNESTQSEKDLERFGKLLEEARSIKGVSLGKDAWRRLKKNRGSMIAITLLLLIGVLAFLAPLLPLQSPVLQYSSTRQYLEPQFEHETFTQNDGKDVELKAEIQKLVDGDANADMEVIMKKCFGSKLNFFDQWLVRSRFRIFDDWAIGSICGTDELGRDLLARIFWGSRVSIMVAIVATLVSLVIGVSYGATAGYLGGVTDDIMMRIVDVLYSIPFLFVVIFLITFLNAPKIKDILVEFNIDKITIFFFVIGAIFWLTMSRVVRGQVISLKQEQFIEAAKTIGASQTRIIFLQLVPNILSIVIVYLTLTIPSVMLFEAFLSFLGLGVEAPNVSWGLLANDGIQEINAITIRWWLVLFPGLTMGATLMALNILGDGLRDALDPRMKNK